jgi:hypothetical protein
MVQVETFAAGAEETSGCESIRTHVQWPYVPTLEQPGK